MIITPFHGVIDSVDLVTDFGNTVGGIEKIATQISPYNITYFTGTVKQIL